MAKKENFFQGVKSEMEKTSWPTKEELFKYTVIVVATVVFFLVFFYAMSEEVGAKRWYAVHTYSGYENKVKQNLEKRVESMNMTEQIFRVVIPEEEETQVKEGKAKTLTKKTFPGYVLVELVMTDESWYIVRNTPGVTGFVGSAGAGSKPNPLLPEEARFILKQMGMKEKTVDVQIDLGEQVRIKSGPFANQVGEVQEIEVEKYKLTVLVDMFGRETPVEVEFDQIEKL